MPLPGAAGAADRDALALLRRQKLPVKQVVRVNPESILYIDNQDRPITAWLWQPTGRPLHIALESGLPAERGVLFDSETPQYTPSTVNEPDAEAYG